MLKWSKTKCDKNRDGACGLFRICDRYGLAWAQWKIQGCLHCKDMEKVIIPLEEDGPEPTGRYAEMWKKFEGGVK